MITKSFVLALAVLVPVFASANEEIEKLIE